MAIDLLDQSTPFCSRKERIAKLVRVGQALRDGCAVNPREAKALGLALLEWLQLGGDFAQHLRITKRGSHHTVCHLARLTIEAAIDDETSDRGRSVVVVSASSTDEDKNNGRQK